MGKRGGFPGGMGGFGGMNLNSLMKEAKKMQADLTKTQEELAEKCNLSTVYIGYVENAKRQIGLSALTNIADVLNIGLDYLVGREDYSNNDELLKGCSNTQKQIIFEIVKSVKLVLSDNNL